MFFHDGTLACQFEMELGSQNVHGFYRKINKPMYNRSQTANCFTGKDKEFRPSLKEWTKMPKQKG